MKVRNLTSKRTGRNVPNQFIIEDGIGENRKVCFQSYNTIVAVFDSVINGGELTLDNNAENYSRTTSKYLYQFIAEYCGECVARREELHRFHRADLNA